MIGTLNYGIWELCDILSRRSKLASVASLCPCSYAKFHTRAQDLRRFLRDRHSGGILAFLQCGISLVQEHQSLLRVGLVDCHLPVGIGFDLANVPLVCESAIA